MSDSGSVEITDSVIETEGTSSPTQGPTEAGHHGMMEKLQDLLHKVQGRGTEDTSSSGSAASQQSEVLAPGTDRSDIPLGDISHASASIEAELPVEPADLTAFLARRQEAMQRELNANEENAQIVRKNSRAAVIMGKVANFAKAMRNAVIKIMAVTGV